MPTAVLVADISGFNQLLEEYGLEPSVRLLERFAAIIQEEVERLGGHLAHIWADEAFALFRTPHQAVRAALEIHKQCDEVRLLTGEPLGVGIGIAAGEVPYVLTGHIGRPISRAADLCARAARGQTLIDAPVRALIPEMNGVEFRGHQAVPPPSLDDSGILCVAPARSVLRR